jgi:hypothetical protein
MEQIAVILLLIGALLFGIYLGIVVIEDARINQEDLTTQTPADVNVNHLPITVLYPAKVKPGGDYVLEIYLDEVIKTWSSSAITNSKSLTVALAFNPLLVRNNSAHLITFTWSPTQTVGSTSPITFGFHIRSDVRITETLDLDLQTETDTHAPETETLTLPVYHKGDLLRKHWWRILWFSISAILIALILIIIGLAFPAIGIVEIIVVVIVCVVWFPQLLETLQLLLSILKEIF